MTTYVKTLRLAAGSAALVLVLAAGSAAAFAQVAFDAVDGDYTGRARLSAATPGPVHAGSQVKLSGQGFKPGQAVTLARGTSALTQGVTADPEGKFEATFTLPADAATGMNKLVLSTAAPYHADIVDLKISPVVPISGEDRFTLTARKLVPGLYQTAYSAKSYAIFVTASSGRPPVKDTAVLKVDPETLEIMARGTPTAAPARADGSDGGLFAVYGVGIDDASGTVWVTNTRQDTVAVYSQADLSLVRQFEPGLVPHARDVVVDETRGKAYASSIGRPAISVFDAKAPAFTKDLEIATKVRGEEFSPASMKLDAAAGKLYVVSLSTAEVAVIDTATDTVENVVPVKGALNAIGVAFDAEAGRILVAGQNSDSLLVVDAASGETVQTVPVGAGALNVVFDPSSKLAFVASRDAGTVTAVDRDGNIVANLPVSPLPNHVSLDGKGNVIVVNKSRNPEDPSGDNITIVSPK
jgi:DNA-binding beta-propeller fold protein YncE